MLYLFLALFAGFIAFCVWLTVRIVNRRERWALRTAVVLAVVVLAAYPLSMGPACWISSRFTAIVPAVNVVYRPALRIWPKLPKPVGSFLQWYSRVGAADGWYWMDDDTWKGGRHLF